MTILLKMQTGQVKLFRRPDILRIESGFCRFGNFLYLVRFGFPRQKEFPLRIADGDADTGQGVDRNPLFKDRFRRDIPNDIQDLFLSFHNHDMQILLRRSSEDFQAGNIAFRFDVHQQVGRSILHHSQFPVRHKILGEGLLFIRLQPGEIRLVVSVDSRHQFDIRAVRIRQIAIPGLPEIAVSPSPLLFARRDMMVGYVQDTGTGIIFIAADKIISGTDRHVGRWHGNILIAGDIDTCRIVHLVIGSRSNGIARDIPLSMIEHGVHIAGEDRLVLIVHGNRRIRPPEERLRNRSRVIHPPLYFQNSTART